MPPKKTKSAAKSTGTRPVRSLRITMPTSSSSATTPRPSNASDARPEKAVTKADVEKIDIASLTLDVPLRPFLRKPRAKSTSFHFLSLPSEIRMDIYAYYFNNVGTLLDRDPTNYRRIHKKLGLMRVCKVVHTEASYYFYSTRTFRIFPTMSRYFNATKKPLLARLKPQQRRDITSLQLRVGPGFGSPPESWVIKPTLGLAECTDVHTLKVYVECDTTESWFANFRRSDGFYEGFCRNLLEDVLGELPSVQFVEFDGWSMVKKSGPMMTGLIEVARQHQQTITWGPERGWSDDPEEEEDDKTAVTAPKPGEVIEGIPFYGFQAAA